MKNINIDRYEKWIAEALSYEGIPYKREDLNVVYSYSTNENNQFNKFKMCYWPKDDYILK